jgi:hypothetical protein
LAVLNALATAGQIALNRFPTSVAEDVARLAKCSLTYAERCCLQVCISEKSIADFFVKLEAIVLPMLRNGHTGLRSESCKPLRQYQSDDIVDPVQQYITACIVPLLRSD